MSQTNHPPIYALLAKYHDIFSLEPGELGYTDLVKHEIRVVEGKPFKEQFQRIPPPIVGEVWAHLKEMLQVGAICPVKAHDVMQLYWYARKTEVCSFALTFISSVTDPSKTPIHFPRYRKPLKAQWEWDTYRA